VKRLATLLLLLSTAYPASAACFLNLRVVGGSGGRPLALAWDVVSGSITYEVRESRDNFATSVNTTVFSTGFIIPRRASRATTLSYRVTAQLSAGLLSISGPRGSNDACVEQIEVTIPADPEFRQLTRKAVVPIAGSTRGANGALFRTQVEMTSTFSDQRGRIIFRPAGQPPSDSDPSVPYEFDGNGQNTVWRDVVAAMGASGIGSLEIIPDDSGSAIIPTTRIRLFHDGANGTFGTYTSPVYPFDYLVPVSLAVQIPDDDDVRVNVGFRALVGDVAVKAILYDVNGRIRRFHDFTIPSGTMVMNPVETVLAGQVFPGERIVFLPAAAVVPFYTITDNRSNDPALFIAPVNPSTANVGNYVQ
jgi:hypothetical protein